jgi:4-amino-4-deoxy-L-arabinose transferase-like glycosyltransferase
LLNAALVGVPLVLFVLLWGARRQGLFAGAAAAAFLAFSPTFLAHASLAGGDAGLALFALLALAAIARWRDAPGLRAALLAGAAIGLGLAAKPTGAFLLAVLAIVALRTGPRRLGPQALLAVAVAFLVCWACYGFSLVPPRPGSVRLPAPLASLAYQLERAGGRGHEAFLFGLRSTHGWWYYYPVAFLLKSTPAEVVAAGIVIAGAAERARIETAWLWAMAVYATAMVANPIAIGQRYLLVLYPLVALAAADVLAEVAARPRARRAVLLATGAALALQVASAAWIAPHYLAYFTPFSGGPSRGWRALVDSNLDWGQDLPSLARALERLGSRCAALSYFGTADPLAYGIRAVPWDDPDPAQIAGCDVVAISATHLQGIYLGGDFFAAFREIEPAARAGWSIFLYRLSDPRARAALAEARRARSLRAP